MSSIFCLFALLRARPPGQDMCLLILPLVSYRPLASRLLLCFWSERARCPVHRPSSGAFAAHIAALTTAAPFTNRLLPYIAYYMSSLARSGTVDRGRAQRARYLGEDDPSDLDDDDSSDARVTMGKETPEPPLLELDACGLVVKFTPPSGATLAMILLHAEGGVSDEARYYCPKTKSLLREAF